MVLGLSVITPVEIQMIFKLVLAVVLGGIIGYEREKHRRPAGFRTHILVSMGAAVFAMISLYAFPSNADPGRMASYVVVGIGFIGAGTVIQLKNKIVGLTTAASLWLTAAIAIAVATEYYFLGIAATVIGFLVLSIKPLERGIRQKPKRPKKSRSRR